MLVRTQPLELTAAQYLELENCSNVRHEYLAGKIYAIATADFDHKLIAVNIYVYLQLKLWEGAYQVYADTKVRIDAPLRFYYPDISVVGKIQDNQSEWQVKIFGAGNEVELSSLGLKLTTAQIYEDIRF